MIKETNRDMEQEAEPGDRRPNPRLMANSANVQKIEKAKTANDDAADDKGEEVHRKVNPKFGGGGRVVSDNQEKMFLFGLV